MSVNLVGEVLTHIDVDDDRILLTTESGKQILIYHNQGCCESVGIVDTQGNWHELIGKSILHFSHDEHDASVGGYDSATETTLTFVVDGATVINKWLGTSNGYYSESVDIEELTDKYGRKHEN